MPGFNPAPEQASFALSSRTADLPETAGFDATQMGSMSYGLLPLPNTCSCRRAR